jgi:hypothetical protein
MTTDAIKATLSGGEVALSGAKTLTAWKKGYYFYTLAATAEDGRVAESKVTVAIR